MKRVLFALIALAFLCRPLAVQSSKGGDDATVYRDEFGIPHIFARTLEDAAFANGYCQAEDRLEELLKNYRRAAGTMAEAFGAQYFRDDVIQRMWRHEVTCREKYSTVSPKMRAVVESYHDGIRHFMKEHPTRVPEWGRNQRIEPWHAETLARHALWGWPLGEAGAVLQRAGITPDPIDYRGSNQMLIAPSRTAMKAPIAIIDPHLSWYGLFRFYQVRIYAGDPSDASSLHVSGVSLVGLPLPSLGHSRWCSIAMTTGGPQTADVFEEEINPDYKRQYRYDGQWRDMTVRKETIRVKSVGSFGDGDGVIERAVELEYTHHGPVVARRGNKAYTMAIPYMDQVGRTDQSFAMMTARNLDEMKHALARLQLMSQNVMVGTVQGDIFYTRQGRVPIRPKGVDPTKPIPGNTSATEWRGIHPFSDLLQVTNPKAAYMHNCNVTPFAMIDAGKFDDQKHLFPEFWSERPYLYNATRTTPRHQRAEMMTDLLDTATKVNVEQAIDIAFNTQVWRAELWQEKLSWAWERYSPSLDFGENGGVVYDLIAKWDRCSDADSEGAMAFYAFKRALGLPQQQQVTPPDSLTVPQLMKALNDAAKWLRENFGSVRVPYGRYFRIGREGGKTYPVGGGSVQAAGMATPRAIGFSPVAKEMVGRSGQTSTQIVVLTNPPKSWTVIPLGNSDDPNSGHWDDQAEKLFSKSKAAPTYFMHKAELMKHVTGTKVLRRYG